MSKPSYSAAITDSLFVLLPFMLLFVVKLMKNSISEMLIQPDYSLAISIMYGQLLSKTLYVNDDKKKQDKFQLFQVIIFIISLLSIVFYVGFQLIAVVPSYIYAIQLLFFVISFVFYIPILTLINKIIKQ